MTLNCQRCAKPTRVPMAAPQNEIAAVRHGGEQPADSPRQLELRRSLTENESQRTEVTSYINQLCIQLHRWKLRLQTLNERKAQLEAELSGTAS
jgi:hypothetical protein